MVDKKKKTPVRKAASKKSGTAAGSRKASKARPKAAAPKAASQASPARSQSLERPFGSLFEGITDLTTSAMKIVGKTRERAEKAREQALGNKDRGSGKTLGPEQLRQMADAGESLRDLREVAGLTISDLAKALNLKDKSFLEAVEDGKEALSMEMIMRLASLFARNDPIPFVVKYVRTYRPKLWAMLEEWGIDGIPIRIERERRFINIYKRRDAARQLSIEGFDKVLAFTQQAFELSLHFIAELEEIENEVNPEFDGVDTEQGTKNTKDKV
jgi:transcriptional regulator with XRE-family HTH domain